MFILGGRALQVTPLQWYLVAHQKFKMLPFKNYDISHIPSISSGYELSSVLNPVFSYPLFFEHIDFEIPWGALNTSLYGGPCQQFVAGPQILSHSLEEPQISSLKNLDPKYCSIFWTTIYIKFH